jgi:hypothetical protein
VKYWAFISYSHKDTAIADWLHQKLETYRVPKSLVGTPSREGEVPSRIMPIFRDREELPTSSELGDNLQKSLQQSRYVIVICSPDAAQSRWVEEEVRAFKGWHGRDRVIALIARGAPNATDRGRAEDECFPQSMRFDVNAANVRVQVEPIAADLRPEGDGRERAFLKIVAGLLGVGFDDLYQREKRRQKRRQMMLAAAAILALASIGVTWWSIARIGQSQEQISQKVATVQQQAAVATTQFEKVRPTDNAAKERIDAAEQRAIKAIQVCEQARLNKVPDPEYSKLSAAANGAILEVEQTAQTTEESIYAKEVNKTARDLYAKELRAWLAERDARYDALRKQIDARNDALRKQAEESMKQMKKP